MSFGCMVAKSKKGKSGYNIVLLLCLIIISSSEYFAWGYFFFFENMSSTYVANVFGLISHMAIVYIIIWKWVEQQNSIFNIDITKLTDKWWNENYYLDCRLESGFRVEGLEST